MIRRCEGSLVGRRLLGLPAIFSADTPRIYESSQFRQVRMANANDEHDCRKMSAAS